MTDPADPAIGGDASFGSHSRRVPRQARSVETRRRLLDAGFTAFATKGIDGVNLVEDVLEPSGISIGSFYHQFADKTELLREILAEAAARRRKFIMQIGELGMAHDLEATVHHVVERLHDSLEQDAAAWQLQRATRATGIDGARDDGAASREGWNDRIATLLSAWFDRPPTELRRASDLMVSLTRGFVAEMLDTPPNRRRSRDEVVDELTTFLVGGLTALLGRPRAEPRRRPSPAGRTTRRPTP